MNLEQILIKIKLIIYSNRKNIKFGFFGFIFIVIVGSVFINSMTFKAKNTIKNDGLLIKEQQIEKETEKAKLQKKWEEEKVQKDKQKIKYWVIRRLKEPLAGTVYIVPDKSQPHILRWNNWLFFVNSEGSFGINQTTDVWAHNLSTGQTELIYRTENRSWYPNNFEIIDNVLLISLGGYLAGGGTFYLDLPPKGIMKSLINGEGSSIEKIGNHLFAISGFGDACIGLKNFQLFNITTKQLQKIADTSSGCTEGDEYIALDSQDRMILANHTGDYFENYYETYDNYLETDIPNPYKYIYSISIYNPQDRQILISETDMPNYIRKIQYDENSNTIRLYGIKEYYILNLSTRSLEKQSILATPEPYVSEPETEKETVDQLIELNLPEDYEFSEEYR